MTVQANFNGQVITQPGSRSQINATALNNTQLGYSGIVAIIGSCQSGQPKVPQLFSSPGQLKAALGSGKAYDAARMAFSPSSMVVEGNYVRPQLVYVVRADAATQSALTLVDTNAASLILTSLDYGIQTNLLNAQVTAPVPNNSVNSAINLTIKYGSIQEVYTNIGMTPVINIKYTGTAISNTVTITSTGISSIIGSGSSDPAISATFAAYPTIEALINYINNLSPNYQASSTLNNTATYNCVDVDYVSTVDIMNGGLGGDFFGVISEAVNKVNSASALISVSRASGASLPPVYAALPIYFTGGTTTPNPGTADYQACLIALQQYRINFVALATQVTVSNGLGTIFKSWLDSMQGVNECHGHIGTYILDTPSPAPTFANLQTLTSSINDVNTNFWSDAVLVPNDLGTPTWYDSWMTACMAAGFQAGTPPGTSFVQKSLNILGAKHIPDLTGPSGTDRLDPYVNGDAMVLARFSFLKFSDATKSWNIVRALTTYSQDSNDYNTEPGIRSATNYAVYSLRQDIEQKFLGGRTLYTEAGSLADSAQGELLAFAKLLESANIIVKGTAIQNNQKVTLPAIVVDNVSVSGDILRLRYGIRPIGAINFIFHTINLNAVQQVATT